MTPPAPHASALAAPPLAEAFMAVRAASCRLVEGLSPEDCQVQSMPEASPLKWHLAHVTWFFETFVLERFEARFRPFDASFRVLFNSYYQAVGPQHPRPSRGLVTRPDLARVRAYREQVDRRVLDLLQARAEIEPALHDIVALGLHHEQQHQELMLTDLKHLLWQHPLRPVPAAQALLAPPAPRPLGWVRHPGGEVEIGHDARRDGAFAFDNEGPRHVVRLAPFEIASRPVTHGDWLAFMDDGGYRRAELWLAAGFDALRAAPREAPLYWWRESPADAWRTFTLQGDLPIDAQAPLPHLSFYEADAYARWAGARLPSEFEWEAVARSVPLEGHFADRGAFHPQPAEPARDGTPQQLFGDVWEWTASPYLGYPRYRPAAGAIGEYNGKFMCDQWVLRGGSCATPSGHLRASYRNFFPAAAQWQFSGLRLARDLD